ncbi:hypothetical protein [Dyadobacter jiangsuensis]|uniref:Uncharacterized protein n=1 Tax=Dyadobacter jiangsuensis TaxID=1591085 RepID=A0A2P8GBD1_9BACT|nr:hypothetical protein [Dyadobacter jiangsuensis]PSL31277.1 hypothetical protein CLV60_103143 [Dyadobacter jiangsuensis]
MSSIVTKPASKDASLRTKREGDHDVPQKTDSIVLKTLRMAETLKKYPKPAK